MTMNRRQWTAVPVAFAAAVLRPALILLALVFPLAVGSQQRTGSPPSVKSAAPGTVTAKVVEAANQFLVTLTDTERSKCTFGFTSSQRTGWSNLPTGIFQRNGLRFGDMTSRQREAALALVAAALSREGYQKVTDIMNGDEVLKNAGGGRTGGRQGGAGTAAAGRRGGGVRFGLDEYYIALLGTPSATAAWMIQFGGHHLAINVTVVGPNTVMTPSLPAAQPAKYILNGQTIRPLGRENDKGFALINALNAAQQKHAILDRKSTRLNSSHRCISYAVFCLKKNGARTLCRGFEPREVGFARLPRLLQKFWEQAQVGQQGGLVQNALIGVTEPEGVALPIDHLEIL